MKKRTSLRYRIEQWFSTKPLWFRLGCLALFVHIAVKVSTPHPQVVYHTDTKVEYVTVRDTVWKDKIVYRNHKPVKKKVIAKVIKKKEPLKINYKMDTAGELFVKNNEGWKNEKYWDVDNWSIGYGHHFQPGEYWDAIDKEFGNQLFAADIHQCNKSINKLLYYQLDTKGYKFSQSFVNGFGDMIYNAGHGNVEKSSIYKALKYKVRWNDPKKRDADLRFIAVKVKNWNTSGGNTNRRAREAALMHEL